MTSTRYKVAEKNSCIGNEAGYYICANCGKQFYLPITCSPTSYAYKLATYQNSNTRLKYLFCCSWSCLHKLQESQPKKQRKEKQQNND